MEFKLAPVNRAIHLLPPGKYKAYSYYWNFSYEAHGGGRRYRSNDLIFEIR